MRISVRFTELLVKALVESMNVDTMVVLAQKLIHRYDIRERTGFPVNIPVPNRDAAARIVNDIRDRDLVPHFAALLIDVHTNGVMGKAYSISYLREIIKEVQELGFIYDRENRMFVEDGRARKSGNWGVLREDTEYVFAFLRLDIAGNSSLVRKYPSEVIRATYGDLRSIVDSAIDRRNGRVWSWEGDGGLAAFFFSNKNTMAMLSAMDIIHELFIYNLTACRLEKPLDVRIAVHSGPCAFRNDTGDVKSEAIRRVVEIESKHTKPNSISISNVVHATLDPLLTRELRAVDSAGRGSVYNYELKWES
jgi:class 3 adenylate cyclase